MALSRCGLRAHRTVREDVNCACIVVSSRSWTTCTWRARARDSCFSTCVLSVWRSWTHIRQSIGGHIGVVVQDAGGCDALAILMDASGRVESTESEMCISYGGMFIEYFMAAASLAPLHISGVPIKRSVGRRGNLGTMQRSYGSDLPSSRCHSHGTPRHGVLTDHRFATVQVAVDSRRTLQPRPDRRALRNLVVASNGQVLDWGPGPNIDPLLFPPGRKPNIALCGVRALTRVSANAARSWVWH